VGSIGVCDTPSCRSASPQAAQSRAGSTTSPSGTWIHATQSASPNLGEALCYGQPPPPTDGRGQGKSIPVASGPFMAQDRCDPRLPQPCDNAARQRIPEEGRRQRPPRRPEFRQVFVKSSASHREKNGGSHPPPRFRCCCPRNTPMRARLPGRSVPEEVFRPPLPMTIGERGRGGAGKRTARAPGGEARAAGPSGVGPDPTPRRWKPKRPDPARRFRRTGKECLPNR
jgi:hypothetical protein